MVRIFPLLVVLILAGCATATTTSTTYQPDEINLDLRHMVDVPSHVQELFDEAFAEQSSRAGFDRGRTAHTLVSVRGFLSIVSTSSGTLAVYVFDFYDGAVRLLSVGGREGSPATPDDPWDVITATTASDIANDAIEQFRAWLTQNGVGV